MSDIIRLLPDSVANQIAAGEVIQRPASVIKELVENCIDAQATEIKIFVKDAGRTLIQIIDNGIGMSETDARMSFERHATSKLKQASDLFEIKTMGFRGEALASIAAIAHVELITNNGNSALGTRIVIEGSDIKIQEPCTANKGTAFSVRNLFYNVPARRNFLKSNNVEFNHILTEFTRIALAYPSVAFSLHHQDKLVYQLDQSNLLQRIVALHGNNFKQNLVPLEQASEVVNIKGFIAKPEALRKDKRNQYFFVNNRFIKHPYLNHAIEEAYEELLPATYYTSYFIYLEVNPQRIDINIHPTKTEVKFLDDSVIYAILRATVKRSLGMHNLTPSMDFEISQDLEYVEKKNPNEIIPPKIHLNPDYNPFKSNNSFNNNVLHKQTNKDNWEKLFIQKSNEYEVSKSQSLNNLSSAIATAPSFNNDFDQKQINHPIQLHARLILSQIKSGIMIIDQIKAQERILYEKKLEQLKKNKNSTQQLLFPETLELSISEINILKDLKELIQSAGFNVEFVSDNSINFIGIPADFEVSDLLDFITLIIDQHENGYLENNSNINSSLAYAFAVSQSKKPCAYLKTEEMNHLIDELFACSMHETALDGSKIIITITLEEILQKFKL